MERRVKLSPQDELDQSDVILKRMDVASSTVRKMLEKARSDRDVVKTLCLNDKLSQIDVTARSARDRQASLQAAVRRNDSELADHEFTILTVLKQRTERLGVEANQCIGEELSFISQNPQVVTEVDPDIPPEDTSFLPPADPILLPAPPICLSCSQ